MAMFDCDNRRDCSFIAIIVSAIVGVITAFLEITGTTAFEGLIFGLVFGIAVVYLAVALVSVALSERRFACRGIRSVLNALLIGALGSILLSAIIFAAAIDGATLLGAILTGVMVFCFVLMLTSTACLAKCFVNNVD